MADRKSHDNIYIQGRGLRSGKFPRKFHHFLLDVFFDQWLIPFFFLEMFLYSVESIQISFPRSVFDLISLI